jgi:aromatic-L-amino-acid decarboxylase
MDPKALADAIDEDKRNGMLPFCVVATVGTTSTSSIDPVPEIVPISEKHAMWLHVDAAYGGSAAIVPEMRNVLDGCNRADSLVLNPHKWLFTPFDCSVLYCRHLDLLRRAFSLVPEYLRTPEQEKVRSGSDYGVQLGRRFRALKLWMIIRYFGHEGLAARIREHIRLAKQFASWIEESTDWELMAPAPFALVCFRANPKVRTTRVSGLDQDAPEEEQPSVDELNEAIMHGVNATGKALLSHTKLNDKLTLRLSIGNIRTTEKHVKQVWDLLNDQLQHHR